MKCFEVTLPVPRGAEEIQVVSICCLHIGAKAYQEQKAQQWRKWIMAEKTRFVFNLGDDTENAVPGDEVHNSMMWDQVMDTQTQRMKAAEYWQPMAEARKMVLSHNSNHWWRSEAKTGVSLARELNVFLQNQYDQKAPAEMKPRPDRLPRWANWQSLTKLNVGTQSYIIHSWHGVGSGCTPEAALRKCRSMATQHHADVYLMGHAHNKIAWSDKYMEFSANGMDARDRERHFGATGGFLGWHDTYAERNGLPPNRIGAIVVHLATKRWDVKIST